MEEKNMTNIIKIRDKTLNEYSVMKFYLDK